MLWEICRKEGEERLGCVKFCIGGVFVGYVVEFVFIDKRVIGKEGIEVSGVRCRRFVRF